MREKKVGSKVQKKTRKSYPSQEARHEKNKKFVLKAFVPVRTYLVRV